MVPTVAVVMVKVKLRLFAYSGSTDCTGNGSNVGFSVYVPVVTLVAVETGKRSSRANVH